MISSRSSSGTDFTQKGKTTHPLAHFLQERGEGEAVKLPNWRAPKNDFFERSQRDLGRPVLDAKIIRFLAPANHRLFAHVPPRQEGRTRRHGR